MGGKTIQIEDVQHTYPGEWEYSLLQNTFRKLVREGLFRHLGGGRYAEVFPHPLRGASPKKGGLVSARLRFRILQRDAYRCRLCGLSAQSRNDVRLEVDHITARSKGGTNDPSNLWTLCESCNRGKGAHTL
jgi:hypothetical protein